PTSFTFLDLGGGRVDDRPHLRDAVRREPALPRVLANEIRRGRDVDAVDPVVGDVALDPLDLGSQAVEDGARPLRDALELRGRELSGARDVALDDVLRHDAHATFVRAASVAADGDSRTCGTSIGTVRRYSAYFSP